MRDEDGEPLAIEGEPSKRYRISCDGVTIGSFDTATELLEAYRHHLEIILPIWRKTSKRVWGRYTLLDRQKEMRIEQVRQVARAEKVNT